MDVARICLLVTHDDLEDRGLTDTIATHERDTAAGHEAERDIAEEGAPAVCFGESGNSDHVVRAYALTPPPYEPRSELRVPTPGSRAPGRSVGLGKSRTRARSGTNHSRSWPAVPLLGSPAPGTEPLTRESASGSTRTR